MEKRKAGFLKSTADSVKKKSSCYHLAICFLIGPTGRRHLKRPYHCGSVSRKSYLSGCKALGPSLMDGQAASTSAMSGFLIQPVRTNFLTGSQQLGCGPVTRISRWITYEPYSSRFLPDRAEANTHTLTLRSPKIPNSLSQRSVSQLPSSHGQCY